MDATAHLWAVGYDNVQDAEAAREMLSNLAWNSGRASRYLVLEDIAVVVRNPDGSYTVDRKPFAKLANVASLTVAGFMAGVVLSTPLSGAALGAITGSVGAAISAACKVISTDFIKEVVELMKPGSSALFVLDHQGDMDVILHTIQGQGGKILKTNVTAELATLIQSTLAATQTETPASSTN